MTPLKANTFISFILLFVLLLLSGGAASQRRRAKVAPPNIQRTDTLQVGDSLQMGDSLQGGKGLPADSLQQDTAGAGASPTEALHCIYAEWLCPSLRPGKGELSGC